MSIYKIIGIAMCAIPFIAIFILIYKKDGIKVALSVFGITALIVLFVFVGIYLVTLN